MSEIDLASLTKPFPKEAIQTRSGGGGKALSYVPTHSVIHRLNDATGNRWDFRLTRFELIGDTYVAIGELTIPGLGTRTGIGVQKVAERSGEDLVKGAASDCLKKCATLFGVALELYGPDYEDEDFAPQRPAQHATRTPQQQPPAPTPFPSNRQGGANLAAVHAAAKGKTKGDPHQDAHKLAEAVYGVPSMRDLVQAQADALRKAYGECAGPDDGDQMLALAQRINAATSTDELKKIVEDVKASALGPDRRAVVAAAFVRCRQSVKDIEAMAAQGQLLGATGTAGADRWTT